MNKMMGSVSLLVVGMLVATTGSAETYDFEIGLAFESTSFERSQSITTPGGTIFNSTRSDTDELSLNGSWYFAGLSDDKGPRARAVFVDRASSLSFGYSRSDGTTEALLTSDDPQLPIPPLDSRIDSDGDTYTLDFRYVDRGSGWFGDAGLLSSSFTAGGTVSNSVDVTGWRLGAGKYLLDTTALSVDLSQVDTDGGGDATIASVAVEHLGDLGSGWQYAVDLGYSRVDADGGFELDTLGAGIALYPTRDVEFGVAVEDASGNNTGQDTTSFEGFASWFVTSNVRLTARYRVDDVDFGGSAFVGGATTAGDADQDSFGIGATVRF